MAASVTWNGSNGLSNGSTTDATMINDNFDDLVTFLNTDVVLADASVPFTAVPSGPGTNPTGDNQFTRKKYVDDNFLGISANATSATLASTVVVADESSDAGCYVAFFNNATGNQAIKTGTNLTFNSSNGRLTATSFGGVGTALTDLDADNISTGTLANARLPSTVSIGGSITGSSYVKGSRLEVSSNGSAATPAFRGTDANTGIYFNLTGGEDSLRSIMVAVDGGPKYRFSNGSFGPMADTTYNCGASGATWNAVYSGGGVYHTSDERVKHLRSEGTLGLDFIKRVKTFEGWYLRKPGTVNQFLSAQQVRRALDEFGQQEDVGMWHVGDATEECPDGRQFVDYEQFIPVLIKAVQELSEKVEALAS